MELRQQGAIRYVDNDATSDAVPMVLLHGLGNSVRFWEAVLCEIGDARRVIALDIPGFGGSDTPDSGFALPPVAHDVLRFIDDIGLDSYILCGHSMGGIVALEVAAPPNTAVVGVVLVDGHLLSAARALRQPLMSLISDPALTMAVVAQFAGGLTPVSRSALKLATSIPVLRSIVFSQFVGNPSDIDQERVVRALIDGGQLNVLGAFQIARSIDLESMMSTVAVPVSLVWGCADRLIRPWDAVRTAELMDVVDSKCLPGVGHWPMLEVPEVLAELLAGYESKEGFGNHEVLSD